MKRKINSLILIIGVFFVSSCELNYLDNPNAVTESSTDANFLITNIETDFADFFVGVGDIGQRFTRMVNLGANTYTTAYLPVNFNGPWNTGYAGLLNDIKALKKLSDEKGFKRHAAIAKTLEAYTLMTMVDVFGDIPYSEALDGSNFSPKVDAGATVYASALALLQSAKTDFTVTPSAGTPTDLFYSNDYNKWVRLVNTLQLKYHLNRKLIDKAGSTTAINALIAENNLLKIGDDFTFKYGKSANDPDSRHPDYAAQWPNGGGDYQSNYYMWHMTEAKGFDDPRAKYYFYRQVGVNTTNASELRCIDEFKPNHYPQDMIFCLPGERGYWGRDHLDNQGIPPDGLKRTLYGVYPAGFRFDENKPTAVSASDPANSGAGIQPIMLASFVDFMLAESANSLGTNGVTKTLLLSGISKSINFVRSWSLTTSEAAKINSTDPVAGFTTSSKKYTDYVGAAFDAGNAAAKNRIIGLEYWLALKGNGVEAYNLYRRTGQPNGMQPGLNPVVGTFPRSFLYPDSYVNRNSNAVQKANFGVKVFWDNNPDNFIN